MELTTTPLGDLMPEGAGRAVEWKGSEDYKGGKNEVMSVKLMFHRLFLN